MIALGVALNTAVFSVVDRILFRSLPYPQDDRLVSFGMTAPIAPQEFTMGYDYLDWHEAETPFQSLGAWSGESDCDYTAENPVRLRCAQVDSYFLPTLGIRLLLGRNITAGEDQPRAPRVAIISYGLVAEPVRGRSARGRQDVASGWADGDDYWRAAAAIRTADAGTRGCAGPAGARSRRAAHAAKGDAAVDSRASEARCDTGAGSRRYAAAVSASSRARRYSGSSGKTSSFECGRSATGKSRRPGLPRGFCSVRCWRCSRSPAPTWPACCSPVPEARQREYAVRAALGAGRGRLACQALIESMLIGLAGGGAGCVLAGLLLRLFVAIAPEGIPRLNQATLDVRVLLFTLAASVGSGVLLGLATALRNPRTETLGTWRTAGPESAVPADPRGCADRAFHDSTGGRGAAAPHPVEPGESAARNA